MNALLSALSFLRRIILFFFLIAPYAFFGRLNIKKGRWQVYASDPFCLVHLT